MIVIKDIWMGSVGRCIEEGIHTEWVDVVDRYMVKVRMLTSIVVFL
jgi:hypothetical protein